MRKALNDNPLVQIGALAVLALLVGFLLMTRMSGKGSETSTTSTTDAAAAASVAPSTSSSAPAPSSAAPDATAAPAPTSPSAAAGAAAGAANGEFVAGPGLPEAVVRAYKDNRVVVLLVVRRNGIDDDAVKSSVEHMAGPLVALFVTNAGHIARYSRIATGVNVDRVPALIVLRPRKLTNGSMPEATVSYGFQGADSVAQAIKDALYNGPTNQPYYPK